MQRYFVSPESVHANQITIIGDDVKHITRVLRLQPGAEVICADGLGSSYLVSLTAFSPDRVTGKILQTLQENVEPEVKITLVQGLPKSDKMDLIVQKGTEVGISCFVAVETNRTIVQYDSKKEAKRRERWQRIAKEAAEQSHRLVIPNIEEVLPLKNWLQQEAALYDLILLAYEGESGQGIRSVLANFSLTNQTRVIPLTAAILIGPEGGFEQSEVDFAIEKGAKVITLGPRILRTETAGVITSAMILYHYGQMGG